jgi:hypothetical protein
MYYIVDLGRNLQRAESMRLFPSARPADLTTIGARRARIFRLAFREARLVISRPGAGKPFGRKTTDRESQERERKILLFSFR